MIAILDFMWLWGKGFLVFMFVFVASELVAMMTRPDYYPWISSVLGKGKEKSSIGGLLLMYVTWPIPATLWLLNIFRNRTLLEAMALSKIEARKRQEAEQKAHDDLMIRIKKSTPHWFRIPIPDETDALYGMTHTLNGQEFLTHIIMETQDKCVCIRAMPDKTKHLPWQIRPSLEEAMQECAQDYDWIFLCTPGKEREQHRIWKKIHARMMAGHKLERC